VSERGTHVAIARARAGSVAPGAESASGVPERAAVLVALADVMDPELPMVSIVDLGMVGEVAVDGPSIRVELYPTFVGCPALEIIRDRVRERLAVFGRPVEAVTTFAIPWSSDRITPAGRTALAAVGIAPPAADGDIHCPLCGSDRVTIDSLFGPTQCRMLYYCRGCRQPFEAIRPV
jgi:ring-1,2-phenylacetyl-CoA epoxidase subunit PaaD